MKKASVAVALSALLVLTGCAGGAVAEPGAPVKAPVVKAATSSSAFALTTKTLRVPANLKQAPYDQTRTVQVPAGWSVSLWARVDKARLAVWTPDGRMLVSRPSHGDVVMLTPGKRSGDQPSSKTLINNLNRPHGLAFKGNDLYIAQGDQVRVYPYAKGKLGKSRQIVKNLPDTSTPELRGAYAHALKSVAVGKDGAVYVSVGSTGNISAEDRAASPERASILKVKNGKTTVYAHGVRNGTGLAIAPDGAVWTAVNNRDQISYPYANGYLGQGEVSPAYVNDHPLEPVARLSAGRDLGWPYCNPDPDLTPGAQNSKLAYANRPFVRDQELNADGSKLNCATLKPVEQGLPAHSAPLGLAFVNTGVLPKAYGAGALIGVHGSWNRTPPREPRVAFLPYRNGKLGNAKTLLGGFQLADGSRWGRPVAAVAGPDKAIYVTDDQAGAIYRMVPPKK